MHFCSASHIFSQKEFTCAMPFFEKQYAPALRVAKFEGTSARRVFEKEYTSILLMTNFVEGVCFCSASPQGVHFCLMSYSFLKKGCTSAERVFEKRCTSALRVTFFLQTGFTSATQVCEKQCTPVLRAANFEERVYRCFTHLRDGLLFC